MRGVAQQHLVVSLGLSAAVRRPARPYQLKRHGAGERRHAVGSDRLEHAPRAPEVLVDLVEQDGRRPEELHMIQMRKAVAEERLILLAEAIKVIDQSGVPQQVKDATRRNHVFEEAGSRRPGATSPPPGAGTEKYATLIAARKAPFEERQLHELRGSIALADKRGSEAVQELTQANQQDPRILYLTALAYRESGDAGQAAVFAKKAARFNGLSFNYAYVRTKAAAMVGPATE